MDLDRVCFLGGDEKIILNKLNQTVYYLLTITYDFYEKL